MYVSMYIYIYTYIDTYIHVCKSIYRMGWSSRKASHLALPCRAAGASDPFGGPGLSKFCNPEGPSKYEVLPRPKMYLY